jgi:hypothetical protein
MCKFNEEEKNMKVVINNCYGGFSISEKAIYLYAEKKGITLYPEEDGIFTKYWTVPSDNEDRIKCQEIQDNFSKSSKEDRKWSNQFCSDNEIYGRDIPRDDTILVAVVEELGEESYGRCAELKIVEIPDGVSWQIEEYDGMEHIAEVHRTWG